MSLLLRFCILISHVLCLPVYLLDAVGLYKLYKRIFPLCLYQFTQGYNKKMCEQKRELFLKIPQFSRAGKQTKVLEVGCGTGANFEFYPPGCRVICTDPNPHQESFLKKSMAENSHLTFDKFVVASGEDMGSVEDESVDVVVCTLVLCSVNSTPQTLREVLRILRPGGAFFFMEHVVADPSTWFCFFQHAIQPMWRYFGDGCEVIRETWKDVESAGFSELNLKHVDAPLLFPVKPHIIGYAVK